MKSLYCSLEIFLKDLNVFEDTVDFLAFYGNETNPVPRKRSNS